MPAETQPHIKPGLYTALVLIGLTLFFYFAKLQTAGELQMLVRVLAVALSVALACYLYSKPRPELTNKEVFFHGFRITAIVTLCIIAFGLIFIWLVPSFKSEAIAAFRAEQLKPLDGKTPDPKTVEAEVETYKQRFTTLFIGMNMMIVVLSGFVGSILGVLVRRKN